MFAAKFILNWKSQACEMLNFMCVRNWKIASSKLLCGCNFAIYLLCSYFTICKFVGKKVQNAKFDMNGRISPVIQVWDKIGTWFKNRLDISAWAIHWGM